MKLSKSFLFLAAAGGLALAPVSGFADEHKHDHAAHGKAKAADPHAAEEKITEALSKLSPEDRKLVDQQRFCPVMEYSRLGEMGTPIKVMVAGKPVFVCCKGCKADAVEGGEETLAKAEAIKEATAAMAKLPAADRKVAESQKYCAILNDNLLGSMGPPVKIELDGKPVYLCCKGCVNKAKANPQATLAKVTELKQAAESSGHDHAEHDKAAHAHGSHGQPSPSK